MTSLSTESGGNINHEDDVTLFVAYDGEWEYDSKECRSLVWDAQAEIDGERRKYYATVFVKFNGEWEYEDEERIIFKNFESSTIFVPKRITLSEIFDILHKHLHVNKKLYSFNLEVQHGTEDPSEIENNQDLSAFISETSETKLPLCVTRIYDHISSQVAGERREGLSIWVVRPDRTGLKNWTGKPY
nr:hypothetical protein [Tanacetum cinerariifolium]